MADSISDVASNRYRYRQSTELNSKQSTADLSISMIDHLTNEMRITLSDDSIGSALVGKSLKFLGEAQVRSIAAYALKNATISAGHLFVKICVKELDKKGI